MNHTDEFERQWKDVRKHVQARWRAMTDEDVNRIDGHIDVLMDLLEEKYGYSRSLATGEVNRLLRRINIARAS
jgi:uncharacterized protein YjbJ (UPF0337 family)